MNIGIRHGCGGDLSKYDLLLVNLVEFVSNKKLTHGERAFLLKLMDIKRNGRDPFHRSSSSELAEEFRFKGPAQRIYDLKRKLREKGYVNKSLSNFTQEFNMLMSSGEISLNLHIDKDGKN